jgi:hypothetical protein
MSEIQDEAYTEVCEENVKLKTLCRRAAAALEAMPGADYLLILALRTAAAKL